MDSLNKTLEIRTSPYIESGDSVEVIMRNVVWALLPVTLFAVWLFGLAALLLLATSLLTCVLTEYILCRLTQRDSTISDWSVVITGLIFGLTLPPGLPLWMVVVGGILAVALGKFLFGGLGYNSFNPALVGRAFLQAAFPAAMTTWTPVFSSDRFHTLPSSTLTMPFTTPVYDVISSATPLAAMKFDHRLTGTGDLLFGLTGGSVGETGSVLILLGGAYLIARRMMDWRIPVGIFGAVVLLSGLLHVIDPLYPPPVFMLFSGGLMLGAMFMATDMVASPITGSGRFIYGVLIGVLIVVIRIWGGMPEGVMYAILFANAVSPHIDRLIQPVVFGARKKESRHPRSRS